MKLTVRYDHVMKQFHAVTGAGELAVAKSFPQHDANAAAVERAYAYAAGWADGWNEAGEGWLPMAVDRDPGDEQAA